MKKNYKVQITNGKTQITMDVPALSVQKALDFATSVCVWGQNFKVISENGKPIGDREIIYI